MFQLKNKGVSRFTILLAVLIGVVLAGVFTVGRFIEQSRAAEVENLINLAASAQERYQMQKGKYATAWSSLDVAPVAPHLNKVGNYVSEDRSVFLTKGGGFEKPNNGFKVYFEDANDKKFIVAERMNWHYGYTLVRPFLENKIYCVPSVGPRSAADKSFCAGYMSVGSAKKLPQDPRTVVEEVSPFW